jgi:hypothetical protein
MNILNLTQHAATEDQLASGVIDLQGDLKAALVAAITFPAIYDHEELVSRAKRVLGLVKDARIDCGHVMIGGMPSFMPVLQEVLQAAGYRVGYACTDRVSVDVPDGNGGVRKTSVFKHVGMYWAV